MLKSLLLLCLLPLICFGYNIPIETHRCAQIIEVKDVIYDITDEVELRYIVRSEDGNDLFIKSISVKATDTLKNFVEENRGNYLIVYCKAPSYFGYTARYLSHSIFDINKDPIPRKEANLESK